MTSPWSVYSFVLLNPQSLVQRKFLGLNEDEIRKLKQTALDCGVVTETPRPSVTVIRKGDGAIFVVPTKEYQSFIDKQRVGSLEAALAFWKTYEN